MSMAEFGFCNMTYGAQSARHEWRESQARKPERKEETAAEKAAAERARDNFTHDVCIKKMKLRLRGFWVEVVHLRTHHM